MLFLRCSINVVGPDEIVSVICTSEVEALDHLLLGTIDTDRGVYSSSTLEVDA